MNSIIVTGATSMLGVALIEEAIQEGCEIFAIVRKGTPKLSILPKSNLIHVVEANSDEYGSALPISCEGGVFYHFAWAHTNREDRDNPVLQERNISDTLAAVGWAHRSGCSKFIGAGSQAEYGQVKTIIDASTKPNPQSSYGACKLTAGILSRKLCERYDMTHIWARVFSVYGPHDGTKTMVSSAVRNFLNRKQMAFSEGSQAWDYLYESDAGKLFYLLGEKAERNSIYRVASGQSRPLKAFVKEMAEQLQAESLCEFAKMPNEEVYSLETSIDDLVSVTGYQPQISFQQGIRDIIDAYRN